MSEQLGPRVHVLVSKGGHFLAIAALSVAPSCILRAAEGPKAADAERARICIEEKAREDPANPRLWEHLGYAWRRLGDLDEARRAFGKAGKGGRDADERSRIALKNCIENDPANTELWTHLGFAAQRTANVEEAQAAFEKAVSLEPGNLKAQYMLGLIYEKRKLRDKAIAAWTACLASPESRIAAVARKHLHHLRLK